MRKFSPFMVGIIAQVTALSCKEPNGASSCGELKQLYEHHITAICSSSGNASADGPAASNYCNVCVAAGLYSYDTAPDGDCACAPLVMATDDCAGEVDDDALLAGIVGAGKECAKFHVPVGGGGSGGGTTASSSE